MNPDPGGTAALEQLPERVGARAARLGLFDGVRRLLVGCSGGGDSVVLLEVLRSSPAPPLELAVAHLHHGWRGAAADADADHVRRLAAERRLRCFVERADLSGEPGSREEAARRARLRFFERVAGEWPADAVALGHTLDDQAETLLMNLARGSGLRGLGAMRPRARVGALLVLRPLLGERRAALRDWAVARGLEWREDASNLDLSLTRNRVRLRLIPQLERIHPGVVANLARTAGLLRDEEAWIEGEVEARLRRLRVDEGFSGAVALDLEGLRGSPRALQRRLVRAAAIAVRGDARGLEAAHVDAVLDEVVDGDQRARDLPGVRVRVDDGRLRFLPLEERRLATPQEAGSP